MSRRVTEILKTVLIACLVCTASLMLWKLYGFASGYSALRTSGGLYSSSGSGNIASVEVSPRAIAVKNGSGRYGASYSRSVVREIYTRVRNAMSGIGDDGGVGVSESTRVAWLTALARDGVYMDFGAAVPSELLSETPCVKELEGFNVRAVMIADNGSAVETYFTDGEKVYKFKTEIEPGFAEEIDASEGWQIDFAGLLSAEYSGVEPDFIVSAEPSPPELKRVDGNPADASRIVDTFGIDRYTAGSYTDEVGAQVYLGQDSTLTVSGSEVAYTGEEGLSVAEITGASEISERERLRAAVSLVYDVAGRYTRDAEFYCVSVVGSVEELTVAFGMRAFGVPIVRSDGGDVFAVVVINGDRITSARIRLAGFIAGTEQSDVLPSRYAAALEGNIRLVYRPSGEALYAPEWCE